VSLAHEEVLVQYDDAILSEVKVKDTLRDPGTPSVTRIRQKRYEQQQAELADGKQRLLLAGGASVVVAALMGWMMIVVVGRFESASLAMDIAALALALGTMFGPGRYITKKAFQSLRRGIFNQHVLLEAGAFAGLLGGFLGLFVFSGFPTVHFFAVSVFITTYHILSEYTSLTVRTRASQGRPEPPQPPAGHCPSRHQERGDRRSPRRRPSRSTTESASSPARASLSTASSSSKETQRSTSRLPPASPSPSRRARATRR